jgi:hypothetical protein
MFYINSGTYPFYLDIAAIGDTMSANGGSTIRFLTHCGTANATPVERMRIDNYGRVGIGTTCIMDTLTVGNNGGLVLQRFTGTDVYSPDLYFYSSKGSAACPTSKSSGDTAMGIRPRAYNGSQWLDVAAIESKIEGTPTTNIMCGNLIFSTNGGGTTNCERMRITSAGYVGIGTCNPGLPLELYVPDGNGIRIKNSGSSDKRWDLVVSGNDFRINETGVGAAMTIKAGGCMVIGNTTAYGGLTISDFTANDGNDSLSFFYRGTSGAHQSLIKFYDFRGQFNSAMGNELDDDGVGTQKARLIFKTSFSGSPTERMRISSSGIIYAKCAINLTDVVSQSNTDTWPVLNLSGANGMAGITNTSSAFDWGFIKGGTARGYYGRQVGALHMSSEYDMGFYTSGWTTQFVMNGSTGNAYLRGSLTQGSDCRLKANVCNLNYGISEIMQLRPVSYNKKTFERDNCGNILSEGIDMCNKYIGFIAQEVKPLVPEVVNGNENSENPEQGLSIEYQNMVALLVKGVQEQQCTIQCLTNRIEQLENK